MKRIFYIVVMSFLVASNYGQDLFKIVDLRGMWRFTIGDEKEWSKESFNDNDWEQIRVPSNWEDQGFNGYDGFGWYRKSFTLPAQYAHYPIYLNLGYIDDADEVYVNGTLIGYTGSLPPRFRTAYNAMRRYYIPKQVLKTDKPNVIAVRVYDSELAGGIAGGDCAIYADISSMPVQIDLQGMWKFATGDNPKYKEIGYADNNWYNITVPKSWEDQGFPDYDGYAWYRKKFYVPSQFEGEKVVLVLGKIDDVDEVYINGVYVGSPRKIKDMNGDTRWDQQRVYYIPSNILQGNKYNIISVRVLDYGEGGGIYEGPVGIIKLKDFVQFWRNKSKR